MQHFIERHTGALIGTVLTHKKTILMSANNAAFESNHGGLVSLHVLKKTRVFTQRPTYVPTVEHVGNDKKSLPNNSFLFWTFFVLRFFVLWQGHGIKGRH